MAALGAGLTLPMVQLRSKDACLRWEPPCAWLKAGELGMLLSLCASALVLEAKSTDECRREWFICRTEAAEGRVGLSGPGTMRYGERAGSRSGRFATMRGACWIFDSGRESRAGMRGKAVLVMLPLLAVWSPLGPV